MTTDMLDRLQENKLHGLKELLQSFKDAAAAGGGEDEAAAIADFIIDEGIGVRQGSRRLWDLYWTLALAGKIPDRRENGTRLRSLLERGGDLLGRAADLARAIAAQSGREVARLSPFEEQARVFPLWVQECMARWDMLDRPRKPLDRERLARSQAAFARGEC